MEYFNQGAVYVEHTTDSISNGIKEVIKRKKELSEQIQKLKKIKSFEWEIKMNELKEILYKIV
jgi:hypothetical protein